MFPSLDRIGSFAQKNPMAAKQIIYSVNVPNFADAIAEKYGAPV